MTSRAGGKGPPCQITCPESAGSRPAIVSSRVVLPAPFGPIEPDDVAGAGRERHFAQCELLAVGLRQAANLERRLGRARRIQGGFLLAQEISCGAARVRMGKEQQSRLSVHAQSPRPSECCAELGREHRLTGSLRSPRGRNYIRSECQDKDRKSRSG